MTIEKRSLTTWERLNPVTRNAELEGTLGGTLADPLWLLARQWQFGEFAGEDTGSPVDMSVAYRHDHMSCVEVGEDRLVRDTPAETPPPPLEVLVEREPVAAAGELVEREPVAESVSTPTMRVRAETGMHFLGRLRRTLRLQEQQFRPAPRDFPAFGLSQPAVADASGRRYYDVLGRAGDPGPDPEDSGDRPATRTLDGYLIYKELVSRGPDVDAIDVLHPEGYRTGETPPTTVSLAYEDAADGFVDWYERLYSEPRPEANAWDGDRLEYSTTVSTGSPTDETVFEATEYQGGSLDWYDFSVAEEAGTLSPPDTATESSESSGKLPVRASFRGMPAARLWEFEDAAVDLAAVEAAPDDLSRLLLLEYALVAGNDWFVSEIDAPVGSVTRVSKLTITDTFREPTNVEPTVNRTDATDWSLYTHDLPTHGVPGLFLPPTLGTAAAGEVVESVLFARDEVANLVFGVEETVEGPLGSPLSRTEFSLPRVAVSDVRLSTESTEEYIELTNHGDDVLPLHGWRLAVETDTGQSMFDYSFTGTVLPPRGTLRVYTGGSEELDTAETLHGGYTHEVLDPQYQVVLRTATGVDPVVVEPVTTTQQDQADRLPRYRIAPSLPEYYFPFVPAPGSRNGDSHRFVPGVLLDADTLVGTAEDVSTPLGRILGDTRRTDDGEAGEFGIYEEEITRGGRTVTRQYQSTSWLDGTTYVWSGRRVGLGTGEMYSGLQYDYLGKPDREAKR